MDENKPTSGEGEPPPSSFCCWYKQAFTLCWGMDGYEMYSPKLTCNDCFTKAIVMLIPLENR